MKYFPCAKINLGLNVISKRADGYHNLETVFYPVGIYDDGSQVFEVCDFLDSAIPSIQVCCSTGLFQIDLQPLPEQPEQCEASLPVARDRQMNMVTHQLECKNPQLGECHGADGEYCHSCLEIPFGKEDSFKAL